jgi:Cytochrome oxidase complex assembly protein 1
MTPVLDKQWSTPPRAQWSWSWRARTRKGWVGLIVGALLLALAFAFAIITLLQTSFRRSEPYQYALSLAQHSQVVVEKLGTPISAGRFTGGNLNYENDDADADLLIPVHGSRGEGKVHVVGSKRPGKWRCSELLFVTDRTGETIDLSTDADR